MNKIKIFLREKWKIIVKGLLCAFLVFINSSLMIFASNFGFTNIAEYIASNLQLCEANTQTNYVELDLVPVKENKNWLQYNKSALNRICDEFNSNAIMFFEDKLEEQFNAYGVLTSNESFLNSSLNILYGQALIENFDPIKTDYAEGHCLISKDLAYVLADGKEIENVLNQSFTFSEMVFVVDGIIDSGSLYEKIFGDTLFLISCYLNLLPHYNSASIKLNLNKNNKHNNFTLFKYMFYSNSFSSPTVSNKNTSLILSSNNNSWLINEIDKIYSEGVSDFSWLIISSLIIYIGIGIALRVFVLKDLALPVSKNIPWYLIIINLFLLLYLFAGLLINTQYVLGIHLLGFGMYSSVFEVIALFVFILAILIHIKRKKEENKNTTEKEIEYYSIEV